MKETIDFFFFFCKKETIDLEEFGYASKLDMLQPKW